MGTTGQVSGSNSEILINGWDRLLCHSLRSRVQSNRPPFCGGHESGNVSALGQYPAMTTDPGPSVCGVTADLTPDAEISVGNRDLAAAHSLLPRSGTGEEQTECNTRGLE